MSRARATHPTPEPGLSVGGPLEAPRYSCAVGGALAVVLNINRAIPILHAGPGCALGQTVGFTWAGGWQGVGYIGGCALPCSNLTEKEVIFGGEERLREQIQATVELIDGDLYVVVNSCIPSMVGDDIKQVVRELSGGESPIYHVDVAGFSGNSYQGYDWALKALVSQAIVGAPKKERGAVNILGIIPYQDLFWRGNLQELRRILSRLGFKANVLFGEPDALRALKRLAAAELTVVISPWIGQEAAGLLQDNFGIPYARFPYLPVGAQETTKFINKIAEYTSVPKALLKETVTQEEKRAYELLDSAGDLVSNFLGALTFAVVADSSYAVGLSKFLVDEAGLIPVVAIVTDNPPQALREEIEQRLKEHDSPIKPRVVFEADSYRIWELLKKESFSLLLGSSLDKYLARDLDVLHLSVSYPAFDRLIVERSYAGYKGGTALLEDIFDKIAMPF